MFSAIPFPAPNHVSGSLSKTLLTKSASLIVKNDGIYELRFKILL
jgi:hypothetical protein